jgi:transposase
MPRKRKPSATQNHHTGNQPNEIRRARVIALYRSGLSIRAVAAQVGTTFQAVHSLLERVGEPRRTRGGNMGGHSRHRR